MARQVIVVGDTMAPHGGTVITGSDVDSVDGKGIARQGDLVDCTEHGVNPIAEGDESSIFSGKPVALHGHRAECGCSLVSRTGTLSVS
ncbi:PAAR domain-containing protein [Paraburkholderia kirstenboschensis]|uniref:PAAR domain-containing protein n=1 Tax=Paraburkholderia kirstenboschensis TaxID=1245436 RepID=A0ABZ0ERD9_9BURK|nr:PAAR domain-containing protein [Paraburkholderia kirstenboschensis]WOD18939.1 PAAR domain-containing protein [Paraburkholderia kirstenboschensis]